MRIVKNRWTVLVLLNLLAWGVLSFCGATTAAPPSGRQPFANSVEQRGAMIRELREIKALLSEQNALLRSGKIRVVNDSRP